MQSRAIAIASSDFRGMQSLNLGLFCQIRQLLMRGQPYPSWFTSRPEIFCGKQPVTASTCSLPAFEPKLLQPQIPSSIKPVTHKVVQYISFQSTLKPALFVGWKYIVKSTLSQISCVQNLIVQGFQKRILQQNTIRDTANHLLLQDTRI